MATMLLRRAAASLLPRACSSRAPLLQPPLRRNLVDVADVCRDWTPVSKRVGAIGMKCGMTHQWTADGTIVPITVLEIQDLQVVKVRRRMSEGVDALQVGGGWRKRKQLRKDMANHFSSKGLPFKRHLREFAVTEDALLPVGTTITARHFVPGQFIDVQSTTRGKGFQGGMKRWGFKGQPATHGHSKSHRSLGSMGGAAGAMFKTNIWKGKKMPGQMGGRTRTTPALQVWKVIPKHNLIYVKGSMAGANGSTVKIRDSIQHKLDFATLGITPPFPTALPGDPGYDDDAELVCPEGQAK